MSWLLLIVFALFAALMLTRKLPALLALPMMAAATAALVKVAPLAILNDVLAAGAVKLAAVYVAVFAGAMMGRVMLQTGIAEGIIKRAAEFGGDKPLIVAFALMAVTAVLFTSLQGLGAIIMVGSLVLPVMMSLGLPRKMSAALFLLAFATGFIFNPILFSLYRNLLGVGADKALPPEVARFAFALLGLMVAGTVIYALIEAKRTGETFFWALASREETVAQLPNRDAPLIALLTPFVPLLLYFGLNYFGIRISDIAAFIIGSLFGVLTTQPKRAVQNLTAAAVRGIEDGAPAAILLMGIGMLLNALNLPAVKATLEPLVRGLPVRSAWSYVLFFGLLSPLALYRGPLNLFGVGIGFYTLLFGAQMLPPLALLAAVMCVTQVQNVCDPTNTHNVWVANFCGVRVEDLTKSLLLPMMLVCTGGLIISVLLFWR